jgi:RNA polymerase sigma-70 factor (ECF subfamily)
MTAMTPTRDSFHEFMERLRQGEAVAGEIFRRFAVRLLALARGRFAGPFKHKVDAEDVVQSAYKSFFRRYGGASLALDGWDGLWGLLALITVRKCAERIAYHRAECRDLAREVTAAPGGEGTAPWEEAIGREPTPSEEAVLSETVEQLFAGLDGDERPILELSLQGYTTQEISQRLGTPERTVRRLRERIRKRLEREQRTGE